MPITENSIIFLNHILLAWASLVVQWVKNPPVIQETWILPLGWEEPLKKEMVTHSSILAWKIQWTEESSVLQSVGLQKVEHNQATKPSCPKNKT